MLSDTDINPKREINLSFKYKYKNNQNIRFYYWIYQRRMFCYTIDGKEEKYEITKYGEYIPSDNSIVYPTVGRPHEIMYYNSRTDTWYDLLYHFVCSKGFTKLYINDVGDVVIYFNSSDWADGTYVSLKYESFEVSSYWRSFKFADMFTVTIPKDRFFIMNHLLHGGKQVGDYNNTIKSLLHNFRLVVDNGNYRSVKTIKRLINGDKLRVTQAFCDIDIVTED